MTKTFIIEDTSFVVALMHEEDSTHKVALELFNFIKSKINIRIVIPTTVIFETLFALIRNKIPVDIAQNKLWRLLMIYDILNFTVLETTPIRLAKRLQPYIVNLGQSAVIPANDLIVIATSLEFNTCPILTFDKKMKTKFNHLHKNIFYCLENVDQTQFFDLLKNQD